MSRVCMECRQPGHLARTCGFRGVLLTVKVPEALVKDIELVAANLGCRRSQAISRVLIEGLVRMLDGG